MTVDIDAFVNDYGARGVDNNLVIILPPRLNPGLMVLNRASDGLLSWSSIQNSSPTSMNVQPSSATNNQVTHGDNAGNNEASSSSVTSSLTTDPSTSTPRPSSHSNSRRRSDPPADNRPMGDGDLSPSSTETESSYQRGERLFQLGEDLRYYLRYDRDPQDAQSDRIMDLIHEIDLCSRPVMLTGDLHQQSHRRTRLAEDLRHFFSYDASSSMVARYLEVLDEVVRSPSLDYYLDVGDFGVGALTSTPPNHSPPPLPVDFDDPTTITVPNDVAWVAGRGIGISHRPNDDQPYNSDIRSTFRRHSEPWHTATSLTTTTSIGPTVHTSPPLLAMISGGLPHEPAPPSILTPSPGPPASSLTSNTRVAGITYLWPMGPLSNFENTNTGQENGVEEVDWNDRQHSDRGNLHSRGDDEATSSAGVRYSAAREVSHNGVGEGGSGVVERQEARARLLRATRLRRQQGYREPPEAIVDVAFDEGESAMQTVDA
ncbi:MAG: hypothetical protein L6R37_005170 [Teloschistes peruensis]|nr:MAG: hypothetical protein L6R37_005170 [Teloschistes peruensis]